jgi:gliding motility-associated-like protein
MDCTLLSGWGERRSAWLLAFLLVGLSWLGPQVAQATHIRAGDIQARVDNPSGNPNHLLFRLTIYRDKGGEAQQNLDETYIYFGDNTALHGSDKDATGKPLMTRTVDAATSTADTEVLYFDFEHTYAAPGTYPVSFVGENRNAGVLNMSGSVTTSFFISSTVTINPAYGANHLPVLRAPAVDKGAVGQVFLHNPAAYDADGDSLAFKLRTCQRVIGGNSPALLASKRPMPVDCQDYVYPDDQRIAPNAKQVTYTGVPAGDPNADARISQDVANGQITWNAPARAGIYNIAFTVEEWRRTANGLRQIGTVIRDMQIIVSATNNVPPTLTVPADVCVVAGTPVSLAISATDGVGSGPQGTATPVTLFAYSGILPPATFTQTTTGTTSTGTFRWTPDCSHVANQPYTVVFKAQDNPAANTAPILIDEKTVRITVIGPPPQNVRSVPTATTRLVSLVTWDRYTCQNASQLLIFRKEGPYNFTPGPCQTGLPAGSGYVQVGAVAPTATIFTDDNGGAGLSRDKTYCYRVYAVFPLPAGGASIVSNETCVTFSGRAARLTNVDVNTTAPAGQITVKWSQPKPDNTTTFGAPYGYRLSRGIGPSPTSFAPVATITNLTDTTYVDRGINTATTQFTYQLTFFSTDRSTGTAVEKTEVSTPASSVRTALVPNSDKSITVNWTYNVPWDNTQQPTLIFRQDPGSSTFTQVGTATPGTTSGTYLDRDSRLQFGRTYCYYVQTNGRYLDLLNSANQPILTNLLNKSQQQCVQLNPTPCTPVLSLRQLNCDSLASSPLFPSPSQRYQNSLRWSIGNTPASCSSAAAYYRVLRSETSGGPFVALDSTKQLSYVHRLLAKSTGCYVVQAVDSTGLRSAFSNVVCQSECVFFLLPNIFTPNGDGTNDLFRPKTTSPLRRTHIQVFNRWGRKVYESDQDPYINWTAGGTTADGITSGIVAGGIYYYLAEVEFDDTANTKRTFKGWVEVAR